MKTFIERYVEKLDNIRTEYLKGKEARQLAQKTCKNEGCSNLRANGSSRCDQCKK